MRPFRLLTDGSASSRGVGPGIECAAPVPPVPGTGIAEPPSPAGDGVQFLWPAEPAALAGDPGPPLSLANRSESRRRSAAGVPGGRDRGDGVPADCSPRALVLLPVPPSTAVGSTLSCIGRNCPGLGSRVSAVAFTRGGGCSPCVPWSCGSTMGWIVFTLLAASILKSSSGFPSPSVSVSTRERFLPRPCTCTCSIPIFWSWSWTWSWTCTLAVSLLADVVGGGGGGVGIGCFVPVLGDDVSTPIAPGVVLP